MEYKSKFKAEEIDEKLEAVSNVMQAYEIPSKFLTTSNWTLELVREFEEWSMSRGKWSQLNGSNLVVLKQGEMKQFMMYQSEFTASTIYHKFTVLPIFVGSRTNINMMVLSAPANADGTAKEAFTRAMEAHTYIAAS